MKFLLSVTLIIGVTTLLPAQQFAIDSLNQLLEQEEDPIRIADIHLGLCRATNFVNNRSEQIKDHIKIAMELSRKNGYREGEAIALILDGLRKYNDGADAMVIYESTAKAIKIAQSIPSKSLETFAQYKLAEYFIYDKNDYNTGIDILTKTIAACDETVSDANIGNCYKVLGLAYETEGQYHLAIQSFEKALSHFRRIKMNPFVVTRLNRPSALDADHGLMNYAHVHKYLGRIYRTQGHLRKAIDHLEIAKQIFESTNAVLFVGLTTEELGAVYEVMGINESAISAYQIASKKYEEVASQTDMSYIYYKLGQVFRAEKDYASAESFLLKSLAIAQQRADSVLLLELYDDFGAVHNAMGNYDKALSYIGERERVAVTLGDSSAFAVNHIGFGQIFFDQENFEQSLSQAYQALHWSERFNNLEHQFISNSLLAANHSRLGQFDSATVYLAQADSISKQTKATDHRMELLLRKVDFHELKEDYKSALFAHKNYFKLHNDLYNTNAQEKLKEEQVRQDVVGIQKEKDLAEREAAFLSQRNQLYLILSIALLLILLFGIYLFYQLRKNKNQIESQNLQLQQLNATKDKFFGIIAHDIRSPIVALESVGVQMEHYLKNDNQAKLSQLIQGVDATAKRLSGLLDNLLNWALLQQGVIPYHPKPLNVKNIGAQIFEMYRDNAEAKGITLLLEVDGQQEVFADESALNTILRNLISNAIKFTPSGGQVSLSTRAKKDQVFLVINDTGTGIAATQLSKIFTLEKASRKGTAGEKGTGLGLTLVKELTELNKGTLDVSSALGEGSRFEIGLPMVA